MRDSTDQSSQAESEDSLDSPDNSANSERDLKSNATKSNRTPKHEPISETKPTTTKRDDGRIINTHEDPGTIAEVLDLTHEQSSPFRIDFDDSSWKRHIDCLKPLGKVYSIDSIPRVRHKPFTFYFGLGLAILVNTCCQKTQEHYTKFCAHVTAVATLDKDLVPVTNRYEIIESRMNSFMHGYVLDIPNSYC